MTKKVKNFLKKKAKGQILVMLGLLFIGLVAIVGLAVDMGLMFVAYSRLNRATDAAALAATGEFKRNLNVTEMKAAAMQLLKLNDVNTANVVSIDIDTCKSKPGDTELCPTIATDPQRKLVRVTVRQRVPLYFLSVVGIRDVTIESKAISEAASLDVVLVLDNSPTMAFNAPRGETTPLVRDPIECNKMDPFGTSSATPSYDGTYTGGPDGLPGECHPFEEVKWASLSFAERLNFEYDRMGIVTFNRLPHVGETISGVTYSGLPLIGNVTDNPLTPSNESDVAYQTVVDAIKSMKLYEGSGKCPWTTADKSTFTNSDVEPCSIYSIASNGVDKYYWNVDCPNTNQPPYDLSRCTLTNLGGAMALALRSLQGDYGDYTPYLPFTSPVRKEAVWVIIVLSDGRANAGYNPDAICPSYTWGRSPQCRDRDPYVRHVAGDTYYDAEDYARDVADIVADNSVFTFSIGFGKNLTLIDDGTGVNFTSDSCIPYTIDPAASPMNCSAGQEFLGYLAVGAPKKVGQPTFAGTFYNVGNNPDQLERVFLDIYNKLTTKLTK